MYVTLLHEKNPYFSENNSLMTPFLLCLRASDKHYFSKYWGKDAWTVPLHLKFGGTGPLGLRPCSSVSFGLPIHPVGMPATFGWGLDFRWFPLILGIFLYIFRL